MSASPLLAVRKKHKGDSFGVSDPITVDIVLSTRQRQLSFEFGAAFSAIYGFTSCVEMTKRHREGIDAPGTALQAGATKRWHFPSFRWRLQWKETFFAVPVAARNRRLFWDSLDSLLKGRHFLPKERFPEIESVRHVEVALHCISDGHDDVSDERVTTHNSSSIFNLCDMIDVGSSLFKSKIMQKISFRQGHCLAHGPFNLSRKDSACYSTNCRDRPCMWDLWPIPSLSWA